jgi:hypothetical protein
MPSSRAFTSICNALTTPGDGNLVPPILDAADAYATVGYPTG